MDEAFEKDTQKNTTAVGPQIGIIVILFVLCVGAGYIVVSKQLQRSHMPHSQIVTSTTTIDLGTTTIQQ